MRSLIFYISTLVLFLGGIAGALFFGYETLPKTAISITTQASLVSLDSIFGSLLIL